MNIINWNSYKIFKGTLNDISFSSKLVINTINQYSYCIAEENLNFKTALLNSDILLPDGIAIVGAVRLMLHKKIKKIAGADIHFHLLDKCSKENKSCFYLGSSEATLNKIREKLKIEYPGLRAGFYSPPYKETFTCAESQQMINAVNEFKPDILFIGMTAPKQETWANNYKSNLNTRVICTIGAVFDFYAETVKRPNKIWVSLGLEWLVRLIKEPLRMWKRYMYYGPLFLLKVTRQAPENFKSSLRS